MDKRGFLGNNLNSSFVKSSLIKGFLGMDTLLAIVTGCIHLYFLKTKTITTDYCTVCALLLALTRSVFTGRNPSPTPCVAFLAGVPQSWLDQL